MSNYNIKNTMNNTKENEENHCNNELIYDKMKIIDLSYEQDSNNKTDQQYEMIGKLIRNEIINLTSFFLNIIVNSILFNLNRSIYMVQFF